MRHLKIALAITLLKSGVAYESILKARQGRANIETLQSELYFYEESQKPILNVDARLMEILTWSSATLHVDQSLQLRRLKRTIVDYLSQRPPLNPNKISEIARSLNKTLRLGPDSKIHIADLTYFFDLLASWAALNDTQSKSELIKALNDDSPLLVAEAKIALDRYISSTELREIFTNKEIRQLQEGLGRPWVFHLLHNLYSDDMRFKPYAHDSIGSYGTQKITPEELQESFHAQDPIEIFNFLHSLSRVSDNPKLLTNKEASKIIVETAIVDILDQNPELKLDIYFAIEIFRSTLVFGLHSEFIDRLLASWLDCKFNLHTHVNDLDKNNETYLIREFRKDVSKHLIRIQQNFHLSETIKRTRSAPIAQQIAMGFSVIPDNIFLLPADTHALDPMALETALSSAALPNEQKLELIYNSENPNILIQKFYTRRARSRSAIRILINQCLKWLKT